MAEQADIYGIKLLIRPTGALTFRRMPSAILHISTYPFLPPSTMSGWLRRLYLMSAGVYPETSVSDPDYFVMPPEYHVLGAYPTTQPRLNQPIHTTKRQGVRSFNHNAFSRLAGSRTNKEVYQLHTWEYLLVDNLVGFVLHRDPEVLGNIAALQNLGCKCGKEGYAFLEQISSVRAFTLTTVAAQPSVPATGQELLGKPADLFVAYRHEYSKKYSAASDPTRLEPSNIDGFVSLWLGWPADNVQLTYLTDGEHYIPAGMMEVF
jgi:hypothetical protein